MPLFMDIHTVNSEDFSVEDVVKAHMEDLAVQEKFGVIQRKYWVNTENKTIFCLMEGPNKEASNAVHSESHGDTACNIIEVSDDEFNLYLGIGKSKNDLALTLSGDIDTGFRTLLIINTYDFTGKYKHYIHQIHRLIKQHNGSIVLQPTDDILVSFVLASYAIVCAIAISDLLKSIQQNYEYKLALVTGKPVDVNGTNLFEDTKKKVQQLVKIGLKNTIFIDMTTRLMADKESDPPKFNFNGCKIINQEAFLLIDKMFVIFNAELYKPDFNLEKLYIELGLSKSQTYRKIKAITGLAPNQLLQELRLSQSLETLRQNHKTIAEIAYDLGFNSPTYFTRVFRKRYNMLPTAFAKIAENG